MVHLLSGIMSVLATVGSYLACNDVTYITKTGKNKYKTINRAITIATLAASVVIGTWVGKAQYSKQLKDDSEIIFNLIIVVAIGVIVGIIGHVVLKMMFESASTQEEKRKQQLSRLGREEPIASNKTQLIAQFYELCQSKGYTDMRDDRQSLKAKVIATDLGLRYGNIVEFYEKAARCYQQIQAEKAEEAEKLRVQRQEEQAEKARRAVNGMLLVTVSGGKETLNVFLRPDHTFYCTVNDGEKIEGIPSVTVHKGGSLQYTYHPSETVFTGASSGGIMMGGTHQTEAHYTERVAKSEKGYIQVGIGGTEVSVTWITMSDYTRERFKRDAQFKAFVSNGRIRCTKDSEMANMLTHSALMGGGNIYAQMSQLTMAADEKRLPYETCREIANLLGRVIHGNFPPTDEEIYDCAKNLAESKTSAQLLSAIEMFQDISDYKDASTQIKSVQIKYEEVLQAEKEQAILAQESRNRHIRKTTVLAAAIIVVFIIAIVAISAVRKEITYRNTVLLMEAGQYEEAIAAFEALDGYKDSVEKVTSCLSEVLKSSEIGDTITFGSYEQDNDIANGKEKIEWLVLDKQDERVLVISRYALNGLPYHTSDTDVTWETCSLRKWLNDDFIDAAFSDNEKAIIPTVKVEAHPNPDYSTNPGNATQDKIFLLSITEANKYLNSSNAGNCQSTAYAFANGAPTHTDTAICWWWLRSPGLDQDMAAYVFDSTILVRGYMVEDNHAVRPAMWIDLSAL